MLMPTDAQAPAVDADFMAYGGWEGGGNGLEGGQNPPKWINAFAALCGPGPNMYGDGLAGGGAFRSATQRGPRFTGGGTTGAAAYTTQGDSSTSEQGQDQQTSASHGVDSSDSFKTDRSPPLTTGVEVKAQEHGRREQPMATALGSPKFQEPPPVAQPTAIATSAAVFNVRHATLDDTRCNWEARLTAMLEMHGQQEDGGPPIGDDETTYLGLLGMLDSSPTVELMSLVAGDRLQYVAMCRQKAQALASATGAIATVGAAMFFDAWMGQVELAMTANPRITVREMLEENSAYRAPGNHATLVTLFDQALLAGRPLTECSPPARGPPKPGEVRSFRDAQVETRMAGRANLSENLARMEVEDALTERYEDRGAAAHIVSLLPRLFRYYIGYDAPASSVPGRGGRTAADRPVVRNLEDPLVVPKQAQVGKTPTPPLVQPPNQPAKPPPIPSPVVQEMLGTSSGGAAKQPQQPIRPEPSAPTPEALYQDNPLGQNSTKPSKPPGYTRANMHPDPAAAKMQLDDVHSVDSFASGEVNRDAQHGGTG